MGACMGVDINNFPRQGDYLNKRITVCFFGDLTKSIGGIIVRDDVEEPHRTIIKLDDGRYVLSTECQYTT